jgi:hypothetical protein
MYTLGQWLQRGQMRFRLRPMAVAASVGLIAAVATVGTAVASTGWVVVSSPSPSGSSFLSGIACVTASNCWTVGGSTNGLIEHGDGSRWAITRSPSNGRLSGIACVSANDCWAVGLDANSKIEHYGGSSWTIARSANQLLSVACVNASACWAVGYSNIAQYNGVAWSEFVNPLPSVSLFGVSCLNLGYDCWAVGQQGSGAPLIEHDTGAGWVAVSTPAVAFGQLSGVTCSVTTNCWAVGVQYTSLGGTASALTEHYDGTAWSVVATNHPNSVSLNSVSCVGTDCWAVGYRGSTPTTRHNLLEHYLTTGWVIAADPPGTGIQSTLLSGVDCSTTTNCWAVGQRGYPTTYTLVEHYT